MNVIFQFLAYLRKDKWRLTSSPKYSCLDLSETQTFFSFYRIVAI